MDNWDVRLVFDLAKNIFQRSFRIFVYICNFVIRTFQAKLVRKCDFSITNTNIYKNLKLREAIFSVV